MTSNEPGCDKARKVEPPSPETDDVLVPDYDPQLDAYVSWMLGIESLHDRMITALIADHDNRMPQDWNLDAE